MHVVLTGGGTGGHLIPFEPIVEALRLHFMEKRDTLPFGVSKDDLVIQFVGVADDQTKKFFKNYDVGVVNIPSGKLRRYASPETIIDLLFRLPIGIVTALYKIWSIMPDVVISKGGYGSLPVVLAAAFFRIPVLLHESDSRSGLSTKILARFASTIAISFDAAREDLSKYAKKVFVTGTPVRTTFGRVNPGTAKKSFGFSENETVLLVMGGSQGAQQINELLLKLLPSIILDTAILHIAGQRNYEAVRSVAQELLASSSRKDKYKVFPYIDDRIDFAYAAADVVVSRAGATSLAELARMKKPALLVPLEGAAADHQRRNAVEFESVGAARVLDPNNLGPNLFERGIRELLTNKALCAELSHNIGLLDRPHAGRDIAEIAFALASGLVPEQKATEIQPEESKKTAS